MVVFVTRLMVPVTAAQDGSIPSALNHAQKEHLVSGVQIIAHATLKELAILQLAVCAIQVGSDSTVILPVQMVTMGTNATRHATARTMRLATMLKDAFANQVGLVDTVQRHAVLDSTAKNACINATVKTVGPVTRSVGV